MGETIVILLIFIILVGLGFAFYARISKIQLAQEQFALEEQRAIQRVQTITHLPELLCSTDGVIANNCVDLYKVIANSNEGGVFNVNNVFYEQLFGFSRITLYQLSGNTDPQNPTTYILYTNEKGEEPSVFYFPVLLHDSSQNVNHYALLEIKVYR